MSSRILDPGQSEAAGTMLWRSVNGEAPAEPEPEPEPEPEQPPPPPPPPEPTGPTWEQHHALEARCREIEQQIPVREQLARQTGFKEGETASAARWDPALERLTRSAAEMATLRSRLRREAEMDVVKLSMTIARRVLRRELTVDPEALLGLVKVALDRVEQRETQRIRVRPEDAARLSASLEKMGVPQRIEVIGDPSLERGGVVLETTKGSLDASLETQLAEIERGFADLMKRP
jgi:flagellar assembly protein FliH